HGGDRVRRAPVRAHRPRGDGCAGPAAARGGALRAAVQPAARARGRRGVRRRDPRPGLGTSGITDDTVMKIVHADSFTTASSFHRDVTGRSSAAAVGALGGPAMADGSGRGKGHDHDSPRIPGLDEVDVENPQPFPPAVLERAYPSDREVDYVPLLSGFLGLQRDHPEVLGENLTRTLEINH